MDMTTITELITALGFPITCVIAMAWFILKIYKQSVKREEDLREEIKENQKVNGKFAEIISKYSMQIEEIKDDVKEIKEDVIIISEKIG